MKNIFIVLVCLFVSFDILAQVARQKDSHEHGAAIIKMVMEDEKLLIEFEVPSESLIGFEHYPKSVVLSGGAQWCGGLRGDVVCNDRYTHQHAPYLRSLPGGDEICDSKPHCGDVCAVADCTLSV